VLLPLSGDARMAVKERGDQIGLVAVDLAGFAPPYEVAQQALGDFRIGVGRQRLPQHGGRDGHIQQMQPAIHAGKGFREIFVVMTKRNLVKPARNGHITAERVSHQLLVKPLDGCQDC